MATTASSKVLVVLRRFAPKGLVPSQQLSRKMLVQIADNLLQWRPAPALEPRPSLNTGPSPPPARVHTHGTQAAETRAGLSHNLGAPRQTLGCRAKTRKEHRRGRRIRPGGRIGPDDPGGLGCGGHAGTVHSTAANPAAGSPVARPGQRLRSAGAGGTAASLRPSWAALSRGGRDVLRRAGFSLAFALREQSKS